MSENPPTAQTDDQPTEDLPAYAAQEETEAETWPTVARTIHTASGQAISIKSTAVDKAFARHQNHREEFVDEEERQRYLYILVFRPNKVRVSRYRPRKKVWVPEERVLQLGPVNNPWVDDDLLALDLFEPTERESKITVFTRLHRWGHVSQQLELLFNLCLGALIVFAPTLFAEHSRSTRLWMYGGLVLLTGLYWLISWVNPWKGWRRIRLTIILVSGAVMLLLPGLVETLPAAARPWMFTAWLGLSLVASLVAWMHWRFTYLILTDQRILLIFRPPLSLMGQKYGAEIRDIRSPIAKDQSWLHNKIGCGIFVAETAAEESDAWMRRGIENVPDHHGFERLVSNARQALEGASK